MWLRCEKAGPRQRPKITLCCRCLHSWSSKGQHRVCFKLLLSCFKRRLISTPWSGFGLMDGGTLMRPVASSPKKKKKRDDRGVIAWRTAAAYKINDWVCQLGRLTQSSPSLIKLMSASLTLLSHFRLKPGSDSRSFEPIWPRFTPPNHRRRNLLEDLGRYRVSAQVIR